MALRTHARLLAATAAVLTLLLAAVARPIHASASMATDTAGRYTILTYVLATAAGFFARHLK